MKLIFIKNQEVEIPIDEGAIITENYNETLDSANIRISHLDYKLDIEPFDQVKLIDSRWDSPKYFCVDDYVLVQESIDEITYSYKINLFSETKLLEGVIIPNKSNTPLKGAGRNVWDLLKLFLDEYGQKIRVNNHFVDKWHFADRVSDRFRQIHCPELQWNEPTLREVLNTLMMVDDCIVVMHNNEIDYIDLTEKKSDIEIKRFETQESKSVQTTITLNPAGSGSGSIEYSEKHIMNVSGFCETGTLTIRNYGNGVIDFIVTGGTRGENAVTILYDYLAHDTINYIQESQSSNNYASEIRMNLQNVFQEKQEGINNVVTTHENLMFSADGNVLNSSNFYLKTRYPILNIKHLWICFYAMKKVNEDKAILYEKVDLCNLRTSSDDAGKYYNIVKEEKEWETLKPLFNLDSVGRFRPDGFKQLLTTTEAKIKNVVDKKQLCLHYARGSNRIEGFSGAEKVLLLESREKGILTCILSMAFSCAKQQTQSSIEEQFLPVDVDTDIPGNVNGYFVPTFQIEYETTANCVFSMSKDDYPQNDRTIVDNQTNSWVDAYSQGNLEKQKANRIGNVNSMINQRTSLFSKAIKIGDFLNDDIVYQVQYEYYSSYIAVNANATKDYILRDYYTGIDSKIRTWVNARDEAFEKHELYKYYVEVSNVERKELNDFSDELENYLSSGIAKYFARPIELSDSELESNPIKHSYFKQAPEDTEVYVIDCISRYLGKTLVFTSGFEDNWILDKKASYGSGAGEINSIDAPEEVTIIRYLSSFQTYTPPRISSSESIDLGGIPLVTTSYVDELGENYYSNKYGTFIGFTTEIIDEVARPHEYFSTLNDAKQHYIRTLIKPKFEQSDLDSVFQINSNHLKDNKEICQYSLQFDFCSENRDIIITDEFVKMQTSIRTFDIDNTKYSYKQGNNKDGKNLVSLNVTSITTANVLESDNKSCEIEIEASNLTTGNYIYIYYDNKLLLITKYATFYLNVLKLRNKNIYSQNPDGEWIKTGEI